MTLEQIENEIKSTYEEIKKIPSITYNTYLTMLDNNKQVELKNFLNANNIKVDNSNDSVDISKIPSLSLYLKELNNFPLLTKEKEIELSKKIHQGDEEAFNTLVNSNLRLVWWMANQFRWAIKDNGNMSLDDLISYGNEGLLKAARKFDPSFNTRFSTYATLWIKQQIKRGIEDQAFHIKHPSHRSDIYNKIKNISQNLFKEYLREPTYQEIADCFNKKYDDKITADKVEDLLSEFSDVKSLDAEVSNNKGDVSTLIDLIPDSSADKNEEELDKEEVYQALEVLNPREKEMVELRYGLQNSDPLTYDEIGKRFNISKERVRQILKVAGKKMADFINKLNNNDN